MMFIIPGKTNKMAGKKGGMGDGAV